MGEEVLVGVTEGVPDLVEVVVCVSVEDGVTLGERVPEGDVVWDNPQRMVSAQKRKRRMLFMENPGCIGLVLSPSSSTHKK